MNKISIALIGLFCLVGLNQVVEASQAVVKKPIFSTVPTTESLTKYPARTTLSKKALQLKIGMTKEDVVHLLGEPTWADGSKGHFLVWSWKNGHCNPIRVTFDKNRQVNGFDEGRLVCLAANYTRTPSAQYSCSHKNRKHLCV